MSFSESQASPSLVVGVDVGGTKVAASVVDASGKIYSHIRRPTDVSSPEATLQCIADAVREAAEAASVSQADIQGIGLGIPGIVDPEAGLGIASVNLNWHNVPVKAGLESRLDLPCAIENDVKAATLGEARFGAGRGRRHLVYLSIGTGIAAGVLLDGKIYRGPNGLAGEIGHAVVDRGGPLCKCGAHGCLEVVASGPAIAALALKKLHSSSQSLLNEKVQAGEHPLSAEDVFAAADQGDRLAKETLAEVGAHLAFAIQFLALAYDPQAVILGGGVAQGGAEILDPVRQCLAQQAADSWVFDKVYHPDFLQLSGLGGDTGILGAAALVAPDE